MRRYIKMKDIIWLAIMIPCCAILSGVGVYAWNRKKPMWFRLGSPIKEDEISDISAFSS